MQTHFSERGNSARQNHVVSAREIRRVSSLDFKVFGAPGVRAWRQVLPVGLVESSLFRRNLAQNDALGTALNQAKRAAKSLTSQSHRQASGRGGGDRIFGTFHK